jgi:hypothetical protein
MAELPIRKKKVIILDAATYFFEYGVPKDIVEYGKMKNTPISVQNIKRYFNRWERFLKAIEVGQPDLWKQIQEAGQKKSLPKEAPKPQAGEPKAEKPKAEKPKATVKPASAVKMGK